MGLDRKLRAWLAAGAGLAAAACGPDPAASDTGASPARTLEGDAALIASAQQVSDAVGGCVKPEKAQAESKVVSLEGATIVMIGCSVSEFSSTFRLFAAGAGGALPKLLSVPDYDASGWFATDQASMAELDAGTGELTTMRKAVSSGSCGSEATYRWDGKRFALLEMHWQACDQPEAKGPPFPIIWPTQQGSAVDPNGATPAP